MYFGIQSYGIDKTCLLCKTTFFCICSMRQEKSDHQQQATAAAKTSQQQRQATTAATTTNQQQQRRQATTAVSTNPPKANIKGENAKERIKPRMRIDLTGCKKILQ